MIFLLFDYFWIKCDFLIASYFVRCVSGVLYCLLVADLFVEDRDYHFQTLEDYNELELDGEEWPGRI